MESLFSAAKKHNATLMQIQCRFRIQYTVQQATQVKLLIHLFQKHMILLL